MDGVQLASDERRNTATIEESAREAVGTKVAEVAPLFVAIYPEGAQVLGGISRSSMYELVASGQLESCRIAGRRMIPLDALYAYAAQVRGQAPDAA